MSSEVKFLIRDIDNGLSLDFELDADQVDTLLDVASDELGGAEGGLSFVGRASLVEDTVLVQGDTTANVSFICVRCAEKRAMQVVTTVDAALMPRSVTNELEGAVDLTADDLDVSFYEGEDIDIDALVREAILLEMPAYPACPEGDLECAELTEALRKKLDAEDKDFDPDRVDPRWAALQAIKDKMANGSS